jgi:hypothetical protein
MHTAGHDERLGLRAALGQAPLDEQNVQALSHGRRLACSARRFKARKEQWSSGVASARRTDTEPELYGWITTSWSIA